MNNGGAEVKRLRNLWMMVICLWTVPSQAALLDPWAFTSLGTLNTSDGITINTDTLQLTGGASYTGVLDPVSGAGIFAFDDMTATNISIFGSRSLGLLSKSNGILSGTIDLLGTGGLDIGASGSLTLNNLNALGSGGDIVLHANQISLAGSINVFNRSINVASTTDIVVSGGTGIIPVPGGPIPIITSGDITIIDSRTVNPVPLPAAAPLFVTGLAAFGLVRRRAAS